MIYSVHSNVTYVYNVQQKIKHLQLSKSHTEQHKNSAFHWIQLHTYTSNPLTRDNDMSA
jgi:hypothetical protein